MKNNLVILIPSYEPTEELTKVVSELKQQQWQNIVVVDDGSGSDYKNYFSACQQQGCQLITHSENQGKGGALKTGFTYIKKHFPDCTGIITADADGQHRPQDIEKVAIAFIASPESMVLGVRIFDEDVPLRSRFGNILTRKIFKLIHKLDLQDTQTGLRAVPIKYIDQFIQITSGHYEYELNCLVKCVKEKISIKQFHFETF